MAIRASQKLFQKNIPNIARSLNTATQISSPKPDVALLNLFDPKTAEAKIGGTVPNLAAAACPISVSVHPDVPFFSLLKPNIEEKVDKNDEQVKNKSSEAKRVLDLDGNKLFSSASTASLLRAVLNLHMASFEPIVDIGIWVMKSRLMENVVAKKIILSVVKHTFYDHFCAGENLTEARKTLQMLWDEGLRGIIDYGLEDATDNFSCDRNLNEFIKTVQSTKSLPPSSVSYACAKITAICPNKLLERVSDLLRWEHKNPSFKLPWKAETLPALTDSSPLYHTLTEPEPLTPTEEQDLKLAHERLLKLSQVCRETDLPLLVDAEYSLVQPAIDYLTYSTMVNINRDGNPIVYGTIQAYFKDAKERLLQATEAAEKMGVTVGFKLVRGAYLSTETQVASSLGFPSPNHATIQDTHDCYNECASIMIEKVAKGTAAVCLATHNITSGNVAMRAADELGVGKSNEKLQFAQLKGMADGLSFSLKNAGFQVSKYLPYGPVEMIIPYLLRRAEENRGLLASSSLDRDLMRKELIRRFKAVLVGSGIDNTVQIVPDKAT